MAAFYNVTTVSTRQKLDIPDSNVAVKKYLAKYITKENNEEEKFCSFIDRSVDTFPLNSVEELEVGSSSSKCWEKVTVTTTETFNFDILPKSTKDEILYGMRYFSKMLNDIAENFILFIKTGMKLLVEGDDVSPQPLPTGRSYRYTDAVYLKSYEIEIAFEKYIEFTSANLNYDSTFDLVQKDSILTIVSLYIYKCIELVRNRKRALISDSDRDEITKKVIDGLIMQEDTLKCLNFDFFMVREAIFNIIFSCYHNQVDNMENQPSRKVDIMDWYLENVNEFMNKTDPDTLEIILRCFANSQTSFEDGITRFITEHPIYQPVAVAFYYILKCGYNILDRKFSR